MSDRPLPTTGEETTEEAADAAEAAGLRYVNDAMPGYTRKRRGKGFEYRNTRGDRITDESEIRRIRAIAIPPAWTDVWICPDRNGHLLATGRDARGRKQYRYHPRWREVRDEDKYGRLKEFGDALTEIRKRVDADLGKQGLPREKVVAAVIRLMDRTLIRVGNDTYARENGSYGLTTIRAEHVKISGTEITFRFKGKSGKMVETQARDARAAKIIKRVRELPGQELFAYLDEEGEVRDVGSADVNAYLREVTGRTFTAKDFRTWGGTVLAVRALLEVGPFRSQRAANRNVRTAVEAVASMLGNTAAVCRRCYIHPLIVDSYVEGSLLEVAGRLRPRGSRWLRRDEVLLLRLLDRLKPVREAA